MLRKLLVCVALLGVIVTAGCGGGADKKESHACGECQKAEAGKVCEACEKAGKKADCGECKKAGAGHACASCEKK